MKYKKFREEFGLIVIDEYGYADMYPTINEEQKDLHWSLFKQGRRIKPVYEEHCIGDFYDDYILELCEVTTNGDPRKALVDVYEKDHITYVFFSSKNLEDAAKFYTKYSKRPRVFIYPIKPPQLHWEAKNYLYRDHYPRDYPYFIKGKMKLEEYRAKIAEINSYLK